MIRVVICDDDIVFTTRVEELILDFAGHILLRFVFILMDILCWNPCRETVLILFLWI